MNELELDAVVVVPVRGEHGGDLANDASNMTQRPHRPDKQHDLAKLGGFPYLIVDVCAALGVPADLLLDAMPFVASVLDHRTPMGHG